MNDSLRRLRMLRAGREGAVATSRASCSESADDPGRMTRDDPPSDSKTRGHAGASGRNATVDAGCGGDRTAAIAAGRVRASGRTTPSRAEVVAKGDIPQGIEAESLRLVPLRSPSPARTLRQQAVQLMDIDEVESARLFAEADRLEGAETNARRQPPEWVGEAAAPPPCAGCSTEHESIRDADDDSDPSLSPDRPSSVARAEGA